MMTARRLGWVKDPSDNRDQDALTVLREVTPPPRASNRDLVRIIDQGGLGSCTANAVGQAVRAAEIVQRITGSTPLSIADAQARTPFMSRLFAYYLARAYEGSQHEDSGTYIRLIFQVLNKYGFPPESVWPYSDDTGIGALFTKRPSDEAYREAYDQRASAENMKAQLVSYSRIMGSGSARVSAIKLALAERHLVAFGTNVTEDFCNSVGVDRPVTLPMASQKIAGGHAMCIAGYDGDLFDVANSWSESFARGGFVTFTREYIEWSESNDFWIVKRAPLYQEAA